MSKLNLVTVLVGLFLSLIACVFVPWRLYACTGPGIATAPVEPRLSWMPIWQSELIKGPYYYAVDYGLFALELAACVGLALVVRFVIKTIDSGRRCGQAVESTDGDPGVKVE